MRNGSMNELKHNAFLKLNASLPECRSLERHSLSFLGRSGNSVSHSPWVVRQVALKNSTQRFPMGRVVGWDSVLQRICRNSHRFNIEIQILVGLVIVLANPYV